MFSGVKFSCRPLQHGLGYIPFKFYGVSVSKIFFKSLSTVSKLIEGVTENTLELLSLCCLMALAECVFFCSSVPPRWWVCHASGLVPQRTCHRPAPPHTLTWDSSHHKEVLHYRMCRVTVYVK